MSSPSRQRAFVAFMTVAGIVFIGAVVIFLTIPALAEVRAFAEDVIDSQTELEAQYQHRKNLLESITKVSHIRQTTDDLKGQFLAPGDELTFITRIEQVAAAHGVQSSIRLSAPRGPGPVTNDAFDIGLIGTYPQVLSALRSIERLPNMTIVSSVTVRAGDLTPGAATIVSLNLKGRIVFTPEGL